MSFYKSITVFGGSSPKPGERSYEEARRLGALLARNGHIVLTGGYIGTMEAVSRGAAEAGGHVIGVTCDEIENWRPVAPNPWVMEELRFRTIRQRLDALIEHCDAAIALPGGVGTLTEIVLTWNLLITDAILPRPVILVGQGWKETFDQFFFSLGDYVPDNQRKWLTVVQDVEMAYDHLQEMQGNGKV